MNSPVNWYPASDNLDPVGAPRLSSDADATEVAVALYDWVERHATETIAWYLREKTSKARWSRTLRFSAVTSIAIGTVAPVVAVGLNLSSNAIWGYGFIGIGAGLIGVDKVFGFSSSWTRYLATATALRRMLVSFQVQWLKSVHSPPVGPDSSTLNLQFEILESFVESVAQVVEHETTNWITEFHGNLNILEGSVAQAQSTVVTGRPG
ncbi:SLATT domain-containing protein [Streptomyces sp. LN704]|uniref:SLATT domain-containing protein n=1 Tax=Streptomyces sp. LN704 TaxID=3112982 RepID=UPI0037214BC6